MRGEERRQQAMLMVIDAERRVPKEHPLRRIKQLAEAALAELSSLFDQMYSAVGRPSIPPERLLKSSPESGDAQEVVGGRYQVGMHLNSLTSTIASFAQTADALHPAERFLDLFAHPLTDSVSERDYRAGFDASKFPGLPFNASETVSSKAGFTSNGRATLYGSQSDFFSDGST
jgi:hypothetical protein